MSRWHTAINQRQLNVHQANLWREPRLLDSAQGGEIVMNVAGKARLLLNFSSNDYLGLATHPLLVKALSQAVQQWGAGSGSAHLVCGHQSPHQALESALAEYLNAEKALLFSTGYMANLAVPGALLERGDCVLQDKLNHASLIDGARLSSADFKRYRHADMVHAKKQLEKTQFNRLLISSDGVFSMDGDIAPINDLKQLADKHDGLLLIDDAHGLGCLGEAGRGSLSLHGLAPQKNILLLGTLGKSFGSFGAFVAGDAVFIDELMQSARSYIYTTAMPAAMAAASLAALEVIASEQGEQSRALLAQRIKQFSKGAKQLGIAVMPSSTAIQPIVIGEAEKALSISDKLLDKGFYLTAIRPPTVLAGSSRLRVALSASHTEEHVNRLLDALVELGLGR